MIKYITDNMKCILVLFQYHMLVVFFKFIRFKEKCPCRKLKSGRLKILYMGGDESQDKSGFLQALSKIHDVHYFVKKDGSYGSYNFGALNNKTKVFNSQIIEYEILNSGNEYDLLLMQSWGWRIDVNILSKIRICKPNIVIANIAMDDRHSFLHYFSYTRGSVGLIKSIDYVFTTSSEAVAWYQKLGVSAFFYPLASDPSIFYPIHNTIKKFDVGFVGAAYGIRKKLITRLKNEGINISVWGKGWENGRLPLEQTNIFYNECKIVLGVNTILGCSKFSSMKLRDFDVPMSGALYVTSRNPDTEKIFKDTKHAIYYDDIDDCIKKIKSILKNDSLLKLTAHRGHCLAIKNNYDVRINCMLGLMR